MALCHPKSLRSRLILVKDYKFNYLKLTVDVLKKMNQNFRVNTKIQSSLGESEGMGS